MHYSAPVYDIDTGFWSKRDFETKGDCLRFVRSHLKYPSEYDIRYSHKYWNREGLKFLDKGHYESFVPNSIDFRKYWDFEKEKCNMYGFIIYVKGDYEIIVPGLYYWYLNFTPIYDKSKKEITFAEIWDGDLHTYMAILLCLLEGKHFAALKKRQFGMSLKITSVLINVLWFGEAARVKIFSHAIVHTENSWLFLEQYRDHLNKHCGWKRGFDPNKFLDWQVRRRRQDGTYVGNMSVLKGLSTERDPSKPVGGGITIAFGEEAGINPTLDVTHEYASPAVSMGGITTGILIYSGSVGELDKCEPLKKFMFQPRNYGFMSFDNVCEGDEDLGIEVGFFVPEWWNYKAMDPVTLEEIKCFDTDGNTNKELALSLILEERKTAVNRDPQMYRHYCSQRPLSIKEAFAWRKDSLFPQHLLTRQEYRIEKKSYPYKTYDIFRDEFGKPRFKDAIHLPIEAFPFNPKKDEIPYGAIKVWEEPIKDAKFGTYYAAVDPISVDMTSTSESLFSVLIYKNLTEVTYKEGDDTKIRLDGDRIVASYVGRKESLLKTNELGELLIEMYNAFSVVENNVDNFIKHMISRHKQKYLATKADLPFLKELGTNTESYQEYGVRTNSMMWTHYINKILEYLKEELGIETKSDGEKIKTVYGVERIPDSRLIRELLNFTDVKGNYDQIVALGLVISLAKARQANGLITKVTEQDVVLKKTDYGRNRGPFKNRPILRNPFKNLK